ncbi:MAG: hypothetical protein LBD53_10705, partial [Tannerella sp.]|nr:hypothetical protein [Tannerella sp.]
MRTMFYAFTAFLLAACTADTDRQAKQQYINVDAQRRLYHSDGTRTYTNYEPFKTRTVALLAGYEAQAKKNALNKYGGLKERRTDVTGFFYVKKLGDRWWCVDPEGCYY